MVYVTWENEGDVEINIASFNTPEEAEVFCEKTV